MRFWKCVRKAVPVAMKTSMWFLKIMLPVSLFVTLLSYFNILPYISSFAAPLFTLIGLPGDAALVFVTSIFTNIYTVIALLATLDFSVRESLIMATMCLISHNFIVETLVLQKTGSSARGMIFLRVAGSFVAAIVLNWILPEMGGQMMAEMAVAMNLGDTLIHWLESSLMLCVKIVLMITGLMILQRVLEEFGVLKILSSMLSPLMRVFGLKPDVAFLWLVGNTVGLAYGSAIMLEYAKEGKLAHQEADLLNYHLAISHSQLEDPLLFMVMGLPIGWLIFPRVVLAIIVVWIRRGIYGLRSHVHPAVKVENVSI
ncbi:nucleoside recognition domain-containing protein [Butyricimonas sp. Marseille-P3923]|uniref:nucleoside recognition domain-containing protein n=1 Tax=Butyricimonas sp. Marseille-P3923 TaxID=1987504 RepID=UPI00210038DC|nr:nucleoside recognition domain-containing protein [Butyricimonas sp. Marseille-P3923]